MLQWSTRNCPIDRSVMFNCTSWSTPCLSTVDSKLWLSSAIKGHRWTDLFQPLPETCPAPCFVNGPFLLERESTRDLPSAGELILPWPSHSTALIHWAKVQRAGQKMNKQQEKALQLFFLKASVVQALLAFKISIYPILTSLSSYAQTQVYWSELLISNENFPTGWLDHQCVVWRLY